MSVNLQIKNYFEDDGEDESDGGGGWQQELQRRYMQDATFMAELRARSISGTLNVVSPPEHVNHQFQQAPYVHGQNFRMQGVHYPVHPKNFGSNDQVHELFGQQLQYPRQDNHSNVGQESLHREELAEHQEVRNKETIEFEEALKQWVNR
ncbi:uncharacterized protein LOC126735482 [Anthonomus grandis grandis]|uniref:uncharacterized protein LOC126735482 n=1 Tax=Anthonomus grandis grandis TaxID=2921223 RepID=UPI00216541D9|nr:uncharacterized protein LOC126735482 [Anthonomus grandis grandis]